MRALTNTVRNAKEDRVKSYQLWSVHAIAHAKGRLTSVFQLMGSTNPLTTSASSSALTLARPMTLGSRFIHVSHAEHCESIAGIGLSAQRFCLYK